MAYGIILAHSEISMGYLDIREISGTLSSSSVNRGGYDGLEMYNCGGLQY
jgi:hypothetical protein